MSKWLAAFVLSHFNEAGAINAGKPFPARRQIWAAFELQ